MICGRTYTHIHKHTQSEDLMAGGLTEGRMDGPRAKTARPRFVAAVCVCVIATCQHRPSYSVIRDVVEELMTIH